MIQPQELRKGNKVFFEGMLYTVKEIKEHEATFLETPAAIEYPDIDPVILTPSILSACGFTPLSDPEFTHHHPELNILFDGESFWLKEGSVTHYLGKCEYLHKLQNGVFWVVGKELIVNIEKVKV